MILLILLFRVIVFLEILGLFAATSCRCKESFSCSVLSTLEVGDAIEEEWLGEEYHEDQEILEEKKDDRLEGKKLLSCKIFVKLDSFDLEASRVTTNIQSHGSSMVIYFFPFVSSILFRFYF